MGRSYDPVVHFFHQFVSLFLFQLKTVVWWDFVESAASWADGVSRDGSVCAWAAAHGFDVAKVTAPALTASSVLAVAQELRSVCDIGSVASRACDGLLPALGVRR